MHQGDFTAVPICPVLCKEVNEKYQMWYVYVSYLRQAYKVTVLHCLKNTKHFDSMLCFLQMVCSFHLYIQLSCHVRCIVAYQLVSEAVV